MNNITNQFEQVFIPQKALLVYQNMAEDKETYVEAYDIDNNGSPVNAHPLSVPESVALAQSLASSKELKHNYLQCAGLMPEKVLYTEIGFKGFAIWYSPAQKVNLYFKEGLNIPCGKANVPALLWKADKDQLSIYALKGTSKPSLDEALYNAPFFNIYVGGGVCMGTVETGFSEGCFLEGFMQQWEHRFFNSYFSHSVGGHKATKGNIVELWQGLVNASKKFPESTLVKTNLRLKDLIK
jgi:PRTRC genetic system protein B